MWPSTDDPGSSRPSDGSESTRPGDDAESSGPGVGTDSTRPGATAESNGSSGVTGSNRQSNGTRPRRDRPATDRRRRVRGRLDPLVDRVRSRVEVDTRALAALRIALGAIILADLAHRWGDIAPFYTDAGAYPLASYEAASLYDGYSVHALSGELWVQQALFVLAGIVAVALILGYRTRLAALVSLGLLVSVHARNPAVLNGGDRLLRVLLFVALLTPLGERWSIDALRRGTARRSVAGVTTAALLVQPIAVFGSNAILKHGGDTWYAGDAVGIALANDEMTILLGNHLAAYPTLLELANWGWVILLSGSVAFLLLTAGRLRALFALAYLAAFAGMAATLAIGLFPFVLAASVLPFLTTPVWDWLSRRVPERWRSRAPTADRLGPLDHPPVERRAFDWLRRTGRGSLASLVVTYGRSLLTVVGAIVLVWIVLFSASHATALDLPEEVEATFPDEQRWGLYAPDPSETYGWYVVEAELEDGSTVDALDGGDPLTDRPPDAARTHDSFRHRKFMQSVQHAGRSDTSDVVADRYAAWACERARGVHETAVSRVAVVRFVQPTPIDGTYEDPYRLTIVEGACTASGAG